ncbi:MAG: glycosyl hydrolase 115 family protein [Treponema sp.]|jgi:hypothetical protein|nr:glycosyl hydrolase 115 family protein [Treponema sp.]
MSEPAFTITRSTSITFDQSPDRPMLKAAEILRRDMEKTLEPGQARRNRIRVTALDSALPVESWIIEASPGELLVRAADSLGCVYALLFISGHFLGVAPFWFWNDQVFIKREYVRIPPAVWHSPVYAVRFRGWFVNDEVLIENWNAEPGNTEHWAMVFEALLRCGGNMTIPGTDGNSRKYRDLAADMGLWITHHHAEPLSAEMFARVFPDEVPSYQVNKILFEKLWENAVIEQKDHKVIWNLGFRGQGDCPFWNDDPEYASDEQRGKLISEIISRQYEIIASHIANPLCCTNLYGEITGLYQSGNLRLPPDIIKIWADNGYGCMVSRRQGNDNPRIYALPLNGDPGPHGIYYHCSFYDLQASNHLTMSPNTSEFLASELGRALGAGADAYWIINCGSVRPHVYALDLVSRLWRQGTINTVEWRKSYAGTYYGENNAESVAALFEEYALCTAKYGPNDDDRAGEELWHYPVRELLCKWIAGATVNGLESLIWLAGDLPFYDQAERLEQLAAETFPKWDRLCGKCAALRGKLDPEYKKFFDDSIFLQARLHRSGALGAAIFCESLNSYRAGDMVTAFRGADKARNIYHEGVKALMDAEHGKWAGYYDGDCLTDIRLTVSCMDALVSWLRICGDGPDFHGWEQSFLVPAGEKLVKLLLYKKRPLDNICLANCLEKTSGASPGAPNRGLMA